MTEQEKKELLVDLCARLPYEVKITVKDREDKGTWTLGPDKNIEYLIDNGWVPYLRPMSSMTEEEKNNFPFPYYFEWIDSNFSLLCSNDEVCASIGFDEMYEIMDWLNAHHFDYRGLIEKGLSLKAPEGMYNLKEK